MPGSPGRSDPVGSMDAQRRISVRTTTVMFVKFSHPGSVLMMDYGMATAVLNDAGGERAEFYLLTFGRIEDRASSRYVRNLRSADVEADLPAHLVLGSANRLAQSLRAPKVSSGRPIDAIESLHRRGTGRPILIDLPPPRELRHVGRALREAT